MALTDVLTVWKFRTTHSLPLLIFKSLKATINHGE